MKNIKRSQICINRANAIIINTGGIAVGTGYTAVNFGCVGAKTIYIYKTQAKFVRGCYIYDFSGDPVLSYPAGQPFPAAEFFAATGLSYTFIE